MSDDDLMKLCKIESKLWACHEAIGELKDSLTKVLEKDSGEKWEFEIPYKCLHNEVTWQVTFEVKAWQCDDCLKYLS